MISDHPAPVTLKKYKPMGIALAVIAGLLVLALLCLVLMSWRRPVLGLVNGKLRPCPDTPNCVCSQCHQEDHALKPLEMPGTLEEIRERLMNVIASFSRAQLIEQEGSYLRYEFTTPWLRFVDDVEFLIDEQNGVVHVRSASRVGHSDLGQNRQRIEEIRKTLQAGP